MNYEESKAFIDIHLTGYKHTNEINLEWSTKAEAFLDKMKEKYALPRHMVLGWDVNGLAASEHYEEANIELAKIILNSDNISDEIRVFLRMKWNI